MLSVKCSYSASQCINNKKKKKQYSELINCIYSFYLFCNIINNNDRYNNIVNLTTTFRVNKLHLLIIFCNRCR